MDVVYRLIVDEVRVSGESVAVAERNRAGVRKQLHVRAVVRIDAAVEVHMIQAGNGTAALHADADRVVEDVSAADRGHAAADVDANRRIVHGDIRNRCCGSRGSDLLYKDASIAAGKA